MNIRACTQVIPNFISRKSLCRNGSTEVVTHSPPSTKGTGAVKKWLIPKQSKDKESVKHLVPENSQ